MVNAQLGMEYELTRRLNNIESQLRALSTQPILLHASTGQDGGQGLSTDKNGLHLFNPAGVEDVTLSAVDGSATFAGPVTINGTLSLPAGIINNAALSNPLTVGSNNADAIGFTVPKTTTTTIASFAFTVPAGYTKVDILAFGSAFVYNAGAATDYVYARVYIGTYGGMTLRSLIGSSGGSVALTPNVTHHIDGLTGGATITISLMMSTDNNAITDSTNQADVTATAFFTR